MTPTPEALAAKVLMTCNHADPLAANPGKWAVCVDCVIGLLIEQAREIERATWEAALNELPMGSLFEHLREIFSARATAQRGDD